eukprot:s2773_g1.t1
MSNVKVARSAPTGLPPALPRLPVHFATEMSICAPQRLQAPRLDVPTLPEAQALQAFVPKGLSLPDSGLLLPQPQPPPQTRSVPRAASPVRDLRTLPAWPLGSSTGSPCRAAGAPPSWRAVASPLPAAAYGQQAPTQRAASPSFSVQVPAQRATSPTFTAQVNPGSYLPSMALRPASPPAVPRQISPRQMSPIQISPRQWPVGQACMQVPVASQQLPPASQSPQIASPPSFAFGQPQVTASPVAAQALDMDCFVKNFVVCLLGVKSSLARGKDNAFLPSVVSPGSPVTTVRPQVAGASVPTQQPAAAAEITSWPASCLVQPSMEVPVANLAASPALVHEDTQPPSISATIVPLTAPTTMWVAPAQAVPQQTFPSPSPADVAQAAQGAVVGRAIRLPGASEVDWIPQMVQDGDISSIHVLSPQPPQEKEREDGIAVPDILEHCRDTAKLVKQLASVLKGLEADVESLRRENHSLRKTVLAAVPP